MFETRTIMTTDVIAAKRHTPISRVIEILVDNDITGLPVVNDDMTLTGIISEKDVLSLLFDLEDESAKVEDFMTKDVVSFEQNEDLIAICECLVKNDFRRVPNSSRWETRRYYQQKGYHQIHIGTALMAIDAIDKHP